MKKKDLFNLIKETLLEVKDSPSKKLLKEQATQTPCDPDQEKDYGTLWLYSLDCNVEPIQIKDDFICCSLNNSYQDDTQTDPLYTLPYGNNNFLPIAGSQGPGTCYCPSGELGNCLGNQNYQFTFADFNEWASVWGGLNAYIQYDPPQLVLQTSIYPFYYYPVEGFEINEGIDYQYSGPDVSNINSSTCHGCSHPGMQNYDSTALGCYDTVSGHSPFQYDCCEYTGCGAINTNPPAIDTSISTIEGGTDSNGNIHASISGNEQDNWWIDNGLCEFPPSCIDETLSLGGQTINTENYQPFVTSEYGSNYDETELQGGVCEVVTCADPYLNGLTDNLLNPIETGYVVDQGETSAGDIVTHDSLECNIVICNDGSSDNTYLNWFNSSDIDDQEINPGNLIDSIGAYPITSDATLCANADVGGCNDPVACNYDDGVDYNDGTCQYCYLNDCETYPELYYDCEGTATGGCTNILENATPSTYDANAPFDDCSCEFNYCWDPEANNYACNDTELYVLCVDTEGDPLKGPNSEGEEGDCGEYISTGCTYDVVGCMDDGNYYDSGIEGYENGQANNYNSEANVECDGILGNDATDCVDDQTIETNPYGCCCQYTPGCTTEGSYNYNPSAIQDDGSCIEASYGCMTPGFDNFDIDYNVNAVSATDPSNPCKYTGCIDDGSNYGVGDVSPSVWGNYVCLIEDLVTGPDPSLDIEWPYEGEGDLIELTVGEWLCGCGGYPGGTEEACNLDDQPLTYLGLFYDEDYYNDDEGINNYGGTLDSAGSCTGLQNLEGCNSDGTDSYNIMDPSDPTNLGTISLDNWLEGALNNQSCQYYGCTDPTALNYFCSINPTLCLDGYVNPEYGTLLSGENWTKPFSCMYPPTFNCIEGKGKATMLNVSAINQNEYGCVDPGDGSGTYNTLNECGQYCRTCSTVKARKCRASNTLDFECLEIDGEIGNPNPNNTIPGTYSIGDVFYIASEEGDPITSVFDDRPDKDAKYKGVWIVEDISIMINDKPRMSSTYSKCIGTIDPTLDQVTDIGAYGCTDSNASNYNASATVDNGSCEYDITCNWCPGVNVQEFTGTMPSIFTFPWPPPAGSTDFEPGNVISSQEGYWYPVLNSENAYEYANSLYDQSLSYGIPSETGALNWISLGNNCGEIITPESDYYENSPSLTNYSYNVNNAVPGMDNFCCNLNSEYCSDGSPTSNTTWVDLDPPLSQDEWIYGCNNSGAENYYPAATHDCGDYGAPPPCSQIGQYSQSDYQGTDQICCQPCVFIEW